MASRCARVRVAFLALERMRHIAHLGVMPLFSMLRNRLVSSEYLGPSIAFRIATSTLGPIPEKEGENL